MTKGSPIQVKRPYSEFHPTLKLNAVNVFFIRNISIRNMKLEFGKNQEMFRKHRQAEVFTSRILIKLTRI